jgi:hypothetical protein
MPLAVEIVDDRTGSGAAVDRPRPIFERKPSGLASKRSVSCRGVAEWSLGMARSVGKGVTRVACEVPYSAESPLRRADEVEKCYNHQAAPIDLWRFHGDDCAPGFRKHSEAIGKTTFQISFEGRQIRRCSLHSIWISRSVKGLGTSYISLAIATNWTK